jgi:hypothetical protein
MSEVKLSFRPRTHSDRRQVVQRLRDALADATTDPRARDLLVELLQGPAEAWAATEDAFRAAEDAERVHAAAEEAADAAWDSALQAFAWTLRGPGGAPADLTDLIGTPLNTALRLARLREVELTRELRSRLDASSLAHDPATMAALEAAAADLDSTLAARARARDARVAANIPRTDAELELNRAAAAAGRALRILLGDATARALLPVF